LNANRLAAKAANAAKPAMLAVMAWHFAIMKLAKKLLVKIEIVMIVKHSRIDARHRIQLMELLAILILRE